MRAWMLAEALIARGHEVLWWSGNFSHVHKKFYEGAEEGKYSISERFSLRLIDAGSYRKNFSFARYQHNEKLGRGFQKFAAQEEGPDALIVSFPTIPLAYEGVQYAKNRKIPALVDVRDYWPQTIVDSFPVWLRPAIRLILAKDFRRTKIAMQGASCLTGISAGCLQWGLQNAARKRTEKDRVFPIAYPSLSSHGAISLRSFDEKRLQGKTVFCYVGSFGRSYDLELLSKAVRHFHTKGRKEIHFVLIGEGEGLSRFRQSVEGLDNVTFTGWLGASQIQQCLSLCSVGIVPGPKVQDAMPNKIFEYLANGLPLLSGLTGELETLIRQEKMGYSYQAGDVNSFCEGVEYFTRDRSSLKTMSNRAKNLFEEKFRADRIYSEFAELVESLVETTPLREQKTVSNR